MAVKTETLHQFVAELADTIMEHDGEPGDLEIIFRAKGRTYAIVNAALRQTITLDLLMRIPEEIRFGPELDMQLEGLRLKMETNKGDPYPNAPRVDERGHRPITLHSSQLWRMLQYARSADNDKEAYISVLREYFPATFATLFAHPIDKPEELP